MNKEQAKKILLKNKLDLSNCGTENIPVTEIIIQKFEINKTGDKFKDFVTLVGLIDVKEKICMSYLIQHHYTEYWFRDYFWDAMGVIKALRVINDVDDLSEYDYECYLCTENE